MDDKFIKEIDTGASTDLATMRLYLENTCPLIKSAYNRDVFLNDEIMRFRIKCESMLNNNMGSISKTQKNIEELQQAEERIEELGSDIDKEENKDLLVDDDGKPLLIPKMKKKMCESVQKRVTYKEIGIEMAGSPEKADEKYFVDAKIKRKITHDPSGSEICTVCPKYRTCPHAHNAIELNYTKIKDKIGNLKNLMSQQ